MIGEIKEVRHTEEQKAALSRIYGPSRIIACAGSGKTTVLTDKILRVIEEGIAQPSQILALTFTNKAAQHMKERVIRKLQGEVDEHELQISTFHSFGYDIIRENSLLMGLDTNVRLIGRAESWQLLYEIFDDFVFHKVKIGLNIGGFLDHLLDYILDLKDHLIDFETYEKFIRRRPQEIATFPSDALRKEEEEVFEKQKELLQVYRGYEEIKFRNNYIDHGDQIMLPVMLFRERPAILARYQNRFPFIFVDEYQDTNIAQAELVYLLAGQSKNVTVVGDDDQGIYGWRGATIQNFLHFGDAPLFGPGEVKDFRIQSNFRSGQRIIDVASRTVEANLQRVKKIPKAYHRDKRSEVYTFVRDSFAQEMGEVAHQIKKLVVEQGYGYRDIAVLCRRKLFELISGVFNREGIPYELIGDRSFFYRPEILDAISWLRLTRDPNHGISLVRILQGERFKICDRDIFFLAQQAQESTPKSSLETERRQTFSLIDAVLNADQSEKVSLEAKERLRQLKNDLRRFILLSERFRLPQLLREIFESTGLLDELRAENNPESHRRLRNLEKLIRIAADFEGVREEASFENFVLYLEEVLKAAEREPEEILIGEEDTVKVMSIHAAKGLEFPVVFVPMLCDGIFPGRDRKAKFQVPLSLRGDRDYIPRPEEYSSKARFKQAQNEFYLEEERRLFYVACTRAMEKLYLSAHRITDTINKREKEKEISPFLKNSLETGLVEIIEDVDKDKSVLQAPLHPSFNLPPQSWDDSAACIVENDRKSTYPGQIQPNHPLTYIVKNARTVSEIKNLLKELYPGISFSPDVEKRAYEAELDLLKLQREKEKPDRLEPLPRSIFSYSALNTYRECPQKYFWSYIEPLPTPHTYSMKVGTFIHRMIELASGQGLSILDLDFPESFEKYEYSPAYWEGGEPVVDEQREKLSPKEMALNFARSRFSRPDSEVVQVLVEQHFNLKVGDNVIVGVIDRAQKYADGGWEIIDFKSGVRGERDVLSRNFQLQIYALAFSEIFRVDPQRLKCTLFFLGDGSEESRVYGEQKLARVKREIIRITEAIKKNKFSPRKSFRCESCSFGELCV